MQYPRSYFNLDVFTFLKQGGLTKFPPIYVQTNSTFLDIVSLVITRGVHRVWVVYPDITIAGVITLTDVMHALIKLKKIENTVAN